MSSVQQHRFEAPDHVRAAVITISDTRTKENDTSGKKIVDLLQAAGHEIVAWEIIPDEPERIRTIFEHFIGSRETRQQRAVGPAAKQTSSPLHPLTSSPAHLLTPSPPHPDVILLTGGTGVGGRDQTFETIALMLTKTLPGFGELFRMLSYEEIGAAAMLS